MKTSALLSAFLLFATQAFAGFAPQFGGNNVSIPTQRTPPPAPGASKPTPKPEARPSTAAEYYGPAFGPDSRKRMPASSPRAAERLWSIPSSPPLPQRQAVKAERLELPIYTKKNYERPRPVTPDLKGLDSAKIRAFSEKARMMTLPARIYDTAVGAKPIAEKYYAALHPVPHKSIRTPLALKLGGISKIFDPPSPIPYEQIAQRIDSLFHILDADYPLAIGGLYALLSHPQNPAPLQARDALFAALAAQRAGWEVTATDFMTRSLERGIESSDRYLHILWNEVRDLRSREYLGEILPKLGRLRSVPLEGDRENYELARLQNAERLKKDSLFPVYAARIRSKHWYDKLRYFIALDDASHGKFAEAERALEDLALNAADSRIRDESAWNLARLLTKSGRSSEASAQLQKIRDDGTNRMSLLQDKAIADFRAGRFHEALGKSIGLESPYFRYAYLPDIFLIDAMSRKALCDFGGAESALERLKSVYGPEQAALEEFLHTAATPESAYKKLIDDYQEKRDYRFVRTLLGNPLTQELQAALNRSVDEEKELWSLPGKKYAKATPQNWQNMLLSLEAQNRIRNEHLKKRIGAYAREEAKYMLSRLAYVAGQAELLAVDIATNATREFQVQSAMNFPARKLASVERDPNRILWPYEQEVWEDELDYIKWKKPSKCSAPPAVAQGR